jgi:tRNA-specific 2-thiouridylase
MIKIAELKTIAKRLGAVAVATGHYARIVESNGQLQLHRGRDLTKDQSYFLHTYLGAELATLLFPLGDSTKVDIRAEAATLGLYAAEKGESQELCFVPTGRYDAFVTERARGRVRSGMLVDEQGRVLGPHSGIHQFTVGQRRNLGVAAGRRVYVTNVDVPTGRVTVGERSSLLRHEATLRDVVFADDVELPVVVDCAIRYRGELHHARVERRNESVVVQFAHDVAAVVNGQFAVFYQGERVVGGGQIVASR